MASLKVKRISWRRAHETDKSNVFVSAIPTLTRSYPIDVDKCGGLLYSCPSGPIARPPKWFGQSNGRDLIFVKSRWYSDPVCWCDGEFVVRPWVADALSKLARFDVGAAKCLGLLDIDLLDAFQVINITDEKGEAVQDMDFELEEYLRRYGVACEDNEWREIIPASPFNDTKGDGPVLDINIRQYELDYFQESHGIYFGCPRNDPFKFEMIRKFGIVSSGFHMMTLEVADLLVPLLPPPFWVVSYWEVS